MPTKPPTEVMTLSTESIEQFRNWLSGRGQSEKTIRGYTSDLKVFLASLGSDGCQIEELEEMGISWLMMNLRKVASKTTARRLTSLRRFSAWAGHPEYFQDWKAPTPAASVPHPLPEGIEGVYRLIEVASKQNQKCLVALCGLQGLRVAEALSTMPSNFNLEEMLLTVWGKGNKQRVLPLSERAWEVILPSYIEAKMRGDNEPLVGLQDRFARRVITNLGERAGLQRRIASHDLRATFGTEVYNRTLDLRLVQELLGHSSSKTTEVYTKVGLAKMRKAVQL